jgi:hypothetical protein
MYEIALHTVYGKDDLKLNGPTLGMRTRERNYLLRRLYGFRALCEHFNFPRGREEVNHLIAICKISQKVDKALTTWYRNNLPEGDYETFLGNFNAMRGAYITQFTREYNDALLANEGSESKLPVHETGGRVQRVDGVLSLDKLNLSIDDRDIDLPGSAVSDYREKAVKIFAEQAEQAAQKVLEAGGNIADYWIDQRLRFGDSPETMGVATCVTTLIPKG